MHGHRNLKIKYLFWLKMIKYILLTKSIVFKVNGGGSVQLPLCLSCTVLYIHNATSFDSARRLFQESCVFR